MAAFWDVVLGSLVDIYYLYLPGATLQKIVIFSLLPSLPTFRTTKDQDIQNVKFASSFVWVCKDWFLMLGEIAKLRGFENILRREKCVPKIN